MRYEAISIFCLFSSAWICGENSNVHVHVNANMQQFPNYTCIIKNTCTVSKALSYYMLDVEINFK